MILRIFICMTIDFSYKIYFYINTIFDFFIKEQNKVGGMNRVARSRAWGKRKGHR